MERYWTLRFLTTCQLRLPIDSKHNLNIDKISMKLLSYSCSVVGKIPYQKDYRFLSWAIELQAFFPVLENDYRIPLGRNLVCILLTSSEHLGVLQLDFETLIKVSRETFWHQHSLKYLRMRKSWLLVKACYLKAHSQVWDNFGKWKSCKNNEKCFYFTSKALYVLKIFKFLSWLFGYVSKRLD